MTHSRTHCLVDSATRLPLANVSVVCVLLFTLAPTFLYANSSTSLSIDEQRMADQLASAQVWQQQRSTSRMHALGVQTLSIELDERKKGEQQRRARVYQFNYNAQRSRLVLIDLENDQVLKKQTIDSVHLPLNRTEIGTARDLVEKTESIMQELNRNRLTRNLPPLSDLSTVDVKASIFEPDNASHVCSSQRCALISLFDQTRTVFIVEPLVNLQSLTVTTLQQSL